MAKKEAVRELFNDLAPRYDAMNHWFSLNIDKIWRKKALREIPAGSYVLDEACGTADFSIAAIRQGAGKVVGIDITENMLEIGKVKVAKAGMSDRVELLLADGEDLPFADETFDAVIIAFGIRNYEHKELGLKEMYRVLKPGGKVVILELSVPKHAPMRQLYMFYFKKIMPFIGGLVSRKSSWKYLNASVIAFPKASQFMAMMQVSGFSKVKVRRFTFGICSLFTGIKPVISGISESEIDENLMSEIEKDVQIRIDKQDI